MAYNLRCTECNQLTTKRQAETRRVNTGRCACGGELRSMRDQQRSKVYKWERAHVIHKDTAPYMELSEIRALVRRIARHYKVDPINVEDGRGRRSACYSHWQRAIKMPRWSRTLEISLHECAHWIHSVCFNGRNEPAHGREFVAVFMYLLTKYADFDLRALARSANEARIDFDGMERYRPKRG